MSITPYTAIAVNRKKTYLIFAGFIAIFTLLFWVLGIVFGSSAEFVFLGFFISIISSFTSYFFSDKIILKLHGAKPAKKEEFFDLYTITENLCIATGMPMPKLYVINDPAPNAFATGRNPKNAVIAVTTGLLQRLDRSDLEGVIAHELSHIKNYDILVATIAAILASTIAIIADLALRSLWFRDSDSRKNSGIIMLIAIISLILIPIAATLIRLAISRKRELMADSTAVLITRNPQGLIDALIKISQSPQQVKTYSSTAHLFFFNPFEKTKSFAAKISNLFSTHPPIEDRIKNLQKMQGAIK